MPFPPPNRSGWLRAVVLLLLVAPRVPGQITDAAVQALAPGWIATQAQAAAQFTGTTPTSFVGWAEADLNHTGTNDYVVAAYSNGAAGAVRVLLKGASLTAAADAPSNLAFAGAWPKITLVDLDGDAKPEIVASFLAGGKGYADWILKWTGSALQNLGPVEAHNGSLFTVASDSIFADIDGNGPLELVTSSLRKDSQTDLQIFGARRDLYRLSNGAYQFVRSLEYFSIFEVSGTRRQDSFPASHPNIRYLLRVLNGTGAAGPTAVQGATLTLNGTVYNDIIQPNAPPAGVVKRVPVQASNALQLTLNGAAGTGITVMFEEPGCDVNSDGRVDSTDISAILAAAGQVASGPEDLRDHDGDGMIAIADAQTCSTKITPDPSACSYVLASGSGSIPAAGGASSVGVSASGICSWSAASNTAWLRVTSASPSTGVGTVTFAADTNPGSSPRSGTLNIGGQSFSVTQGGNSCVYTLTSTSMALDSSAASLPIGVTVNPVNCVWNASGTNSWLTLSAVGPFTSHGSLTVAVSANTTGLERQAILSIAGQTYTVIQRASATSFQDVTPADFFFDPVNMLRSLSITAGCSATPLKYCANDNVTRGQMAVFVVRAAMGGDIFPYSTAPAFADVPAAHPFFKWIQKMKELGITAGCSATQYCPDDLVTRGQMAVFIIRSRFGSTATFPYSSAPAFADVSPSHAFFSWIQKMKEIGITAGCSATQYCPDSPVTRGQMAIFILRGALNRLLPSSTPLITSSLPGSGGRGMTLNLTVMGVNTHFVQGVTQIDAGPGIAVGTMVVLGPQTLLVQCTVAAAASLGPRSLTVRTNGEDATLPSGLQILQ